MNARAAAHDASVQMIDTSIAIPKRLFARQVRVKVGRSILKRFQMGGQSLESEVVKGQTARMPDSSFCADQISDQSRHFSKGGIGTVSSI